MFEDFINNQDNWLSGKGPESEIVFSSRIRLARNIVNFPFPSRANNGQKEKIKAKVMDACSGMERFRNGVFADMDKVSSLDVQLLLERHLISQEFSMPAKGRGLIVSSDEHLSVMINEEDHLRMQVIVSGFDLNRCWKALDEFDNELNKRIPFYFSSDLGYLTACPTNVGIAMRASCMMHLPALILTKRINRILELLARIAITARGLFGEGTQALGDFFQISNQASLGSSEEEVIGNLVGVVNQVKEQEQEARDILLKKYKRNLEDNVWRALGILRNSRLINSKEFLSYLSILSLGLDLGIIKDTDLSSTEKGRSLVNSLFIMVQPAHLQKMEGKSFKEEERDYVRAEKIRQRLLR